MRLAPCSAHISGGLFGHAVGNVYFCTLMGTSLWAHTQEGNLPIAPFNKNKEDTDTIMTPEELMARVAEMYGIETTLELAEDYALGNPHAGPQDFYMWLRSRGEV